MKTGGDMKMSNRCIKQLNEKQMNEKRPKRNGRNEKKVLEMHCIVAAAAAAAAAAVATYESTPTEDSNKHNFEGGCLCKLNFDLLHKLGLKIRVQNSEICPRF